MLMPELVMVSNLSNCSTTKPNTNNISFTDLNECLTSNGNCAQMCNNIMGSYTCSCNTGYALNVNARTCDGE